MLCDSFVETVISGRPQIQCVGDILESSSRIIDIIPKHSPKVGDIIPSRRKENRKVACKLRVHFSNR